MKFIITNNKPSKNETDELFLPVFEKWLMGRLSVRRLADKLYDIQELQLPNYPIFRQKREQ